jgi:hypothetical protein
MVVGERKVVGAIKRRTEARQIYEAALLAGHTTALLEQERPNIFTQSVGNIAPGEEVQIEISYVDVLRYDVGTYEFAFPMVVGPRYNPGGPIAAPADTPAELEGKVSPPVADTTRVPDASRISPPVLKPEFRNGHDVNVKLSIDAGVPVHKLEVANHKAAVERDGDHKATIELDPGDTIPNKDFVVRYTVMGDKPEMALLAHTGNYSGDATRLGSGYFLLMIQPQDDERLHKSPPREMVFLVDVSGSMSGEPTAKVVETMQHMLKMCREIDTVQVITFAGQANQLFEKPLPVNDDSIKRALNFTEGLRGSGGTEMLKGVKLAIDQPIDKERLRIVVMLTDGYIGNEAEIIEHVGKHCGDQIRFWTVGIGSSPNMFLVDGTAKQGGGMGKQLGLQDDSDALSTEIMTRIQRAQLSKINIDWGDLAVSETYPTRIPELWAGRPIMVVGRFDGAGKHTINVKGNVEGEDVAWPLEVALPDSERAHDVLAKVWARKKIEDLMQQTFYLGSEPIEEEVTALALDYKLMSQYTSFVAVDPEMPIDVGPAAKPPRRMLVPVPLPAGTRWEGFFGPGGEGGFAELGDALIIRRDEVEALRAFPSPRVSVFNGQNEFSGRGPQFGGFDSRGSGRGGYGGGFGKRNADGGFAYQTSRTPYVTSVVPLVASAGESSDKKLKDLSRSIRAHGWSEAEQWGFDYYTRYSLSRGALTGEAGKAIRTQNEALAELESQLATIPYDDRARALYDVHAAIRPTDEKLQLLVNAAKEEAQAAVENKDDGKRRAALLRVVFLDSASANVGASDGSSAAEALAALELMRFEQVAKWAKVTPALEEKLDLVLRDKSLEEALAAVAKASGLDIALVPGSTDDAASMLLVEPRVSYLDLRGATVAQALDWICQPARLTWSRSEKGIVAGTERRMGGQSCWVYDVSLIALPSAKEFEKIEKDEDKAKAVAEQTAAFLPAVQKALEPGEGQLIQWYAPGQLLVIGGVDLHSKAGRLLERLADPKAKFDNVALAALHKETSARAADRRDGDATLATLRSRMMAAGAHEAFIWPLLSAAAGGKLDLEALTELQIAWKSPQTEKLLETPAASLVFRSLWAVSEASRSLPDNAELAALAKLAREKTRPAFDKQLEALEKEPESAGAFACVLYGALALRDDAELSARATKALTAPREKEKQSQLAAAITLAEALLGDPQNIDGEALSQLVSSGVYGEEMVALVAIACKRAGGDAWDTFRREQTYLLGSQPLSGDVVVLVNRLSLGRVALAEPVAQR